MYKAQLQLHNKMTLLVETNIYIRLADSVDSFKAQLKTHLFAKAYPM